jgi:hypothetical protein
MRATPKVAECGARPVPQDPNRNAIFKIKKFCIKVKFFDKHSAKFDMRAFHHDF